MYRVGFPGWKIAARIGVPILVKIDVIHDKEAKVFVATSRDLPGLVVETNAMEKLFPEVDRKSVVEGKSVYVGGGRLI